MKLKKFIAIGLILLFIGGIFLPTVSAKRDDFSIPVSITWIGENGVPQTNCIFLSKGKILRLLFLLETLQGFHGKRNNLRSLIQEIQKTGILGDLNIEWLDKLPGKPVLSLGKGRAYFTPYHARVQIKRLLTTWHYPSGAGVTIIWGNGLSSPPTQILLKRQVGLMLGFVGIYIYIPPLFEGMSSRVFFLGSATFAWGLTF